VLRSFRGSRKFKQTMIDLFKQLLVSQFEASLCTLAHAVEQCPEELWNAPVARYLFCQVAFHTLFFTDVYLGLSPESLTQQPFHRANAALFGDYEQMQEREPVTLYDRPQIMGYLDFCRSKASEAISMETAESLAAPAQFARRHFSRAELYLYNIRHIQHHAAQLIMRLRLDSDIDVSWIGAGWRDPLPLPSEES